jgi:hypothetical protein
VELHESKAERAMRKKRDQELIELLNELRVALPGAQVLLAFLLVAPLNAGFNEVDGVAKAVYLVSLTFTVLATTLLMAPSAYHRLRWRERNKDRMLRVSNQLAIAGLACLAIALSAAVFVVVDVLYSEPLAAVFAVGVFGLFAVGWFVLPLRQPYERWDEPLDEEHLEALGGEDALGSHEPPPG